jgi:hypothetical protein
MDYPFPAGLPLPPAVVSQASPSHDKAALPHDQSSHSREEGELSDTGVGPNQHRSDERILHTGEQSLLPNMTIGVQPPTRNGLEGRGSFRDHQSKFWRLGDPTWGVSYGARVLTVIFRPNVNQHLWCRGSYHFHTPLPARSGT